MATSRTPLPLGGMSRRWRSPQRCLSASICPIAPITFPRNYPEAKCSASRSVALVTESEAVLCDEPTGNLDSVNSREILGLLRELTEAGKRSVDMVPHDPLAATICDRIIHIADVAIASEQRIPLRPGVAV